MADQSSVPTLSFKEAPPADNEEKLAWEKDLLGLYVSGHPLDRFRERLAGKGAIKDVKEYQEGGIAIFAALIDDIRMVITKKGERMCFVKLVDKESFIEAVVFPRTYEEVKAVLVPNACIIFQGRISKRNGEISVMAEKIKNL
jgi:DNA polymerase-3 subunit alpha